MATQTEIKELYSNEDYCKEELLRGRAIMGNKDTTRKEWSAMEASIQFMYLYCPISMQGIVHGMLLEITMREKYMYPIWGTA